MSIKKISIVGTVGIPACYGGFESLVENLTINSSEKIQYEVFCSSKYYDNKYQVHNRAKLTYIPLSANGVQSIPYDIISLVKCLFSRPDSIVVLGVSGCLFLPVFKVFSKSKIIINIDGLEWKRAKWNFFIKKFLKLSERFAIKYADVVITDNQAIGDYVYREYGVKSVTIAYGGDHAIRDGNILSLCDEEYSLSVCRIEPENNVEMILEAFSKTNKRLKFIGNWGSSEFGQNLKKKYCSFDNIEIIDPIYDLDELFKLRSMCSSYIHGHSAGGTNPSLVEMMHFGIPIFAYDCSFNRYSTNSQACYFDSAERLNHMIENSELSILKENALSMKKIAKEKYMWKIITKDYENTY